MSKKYDATIVEFFKHNDADLQELTNSKKDRYNKDSQGLFHKGMAANIDWVRQAPLEIALMELQQVLKDGYTMIKVITEPLYFKAILRKPDDVIAGEMPELEQRALEEYEQDRYERNRSETTRQIAITVEQSKRRAEEAATKAAAKRQASEEEKALADLHRAYGSATQEGETA